MNDVCVYIHTRLDGVVFYVGIGLEKRPYDSRQRNPHWHYTVARHAYEVTILHQDLSWEDACIIERDLIKKYRGISGEKLCNITDGGDGMMGWVASDITRRRMSVAAMGNQNSLGFKQSEETKAKVRAVHLGAKRSEETKEKMRQARLGKKHSIETRQKLSEASRGNQRWLGRRHSAESIAKMSESRKALFQQGEGK